MINQEIFVQLIKTLLVKMDNIETIKDNVQIAKHNTVDTAQVIQHANTASETKIG